MSLAKRLESLRERAQRDVLAIGRRRRCCRPSHAAMPAEIAERHYLTPVRLGRAPPTTRRDRSRWRSPASRAARRRAAPPIVVPGTRVDLYVARRGRRDARLHARRRRRPRARQHRDRPGASGVWSSATLPSTRPRIARTTSSRAALQMVEADVERANEVVREFNEDLMPGLGRGPGGGPGAGSRAPQARRGPQAPEVLRALVGPAVAAALRGRQL